MKVAPTLHLLRPFTEWIDRRDRCEIVTVEHAAEYVRWIRKSSARDGGPEFGTWTSRPPRRPLKRGKSSVYFCRSGHALFRMPFIRIEERYDGSWAILLECEVRHVEPKRIGFLRGWRYLADDARPADLPAAEDPMDDGMRRDLKAAGLL